MEVNYADSPLTLLQIKSNFKDINGHESSLNHPGKSQDWVCGLGSSLTCISGKTGMSPLKSVGLILL